MDESYFLALLLKDYLHSYKIQMYKTFVLRISQHAIIKFFVPYSFDASSYTRMLLPTACCIRAHVIWFVSCLYYVVGICLLLSPDIFSVGYS